MSFVSGSVIPWSIILLTLSAHATTFFQRPFPESVKSSQIIVRGVIGPSHADWGPGEDGTRRIYTFTELKLTEVFKGNVPTSDLVFREIGGVKEGIGLEVAGAARFREGEDVVVFLFPKNGDGTYDLKGMMMGKLNVRRDETTGEEYLTGPAIGGATHPALRGHEQEVHDAAQSPGGRWTLAELRRLVLPGGPAPAPIHSDSVNSGLPSKNPPIAPPSLKPETPPRTAPGLQPPTSEGGDSSGTRQILLGLATLVLIGWVSWKSLFRK